MSNSLMTNINGQVLYGKDFIKPHYLIARIIC